MKKILTSLLLASIVAIPLHAIETESHNNRLYFTITECNDLSLVPITLYLENPSIDITAIEMYFTLPEGVNITSIESTTRCATNHEITTGDTPNGYFISIASENIEKFDDTEGAVCTLFCDFSPLADGDYTISTSGVFAVGVADEIITCYTTANQEEQFTKNSVSGIESISLNASNSSLEIYNIQGIRLKEPQKGQINIINGKKVIL
ncbi:MAG: hypothetical protein IKV32_02670 [Muribaculaceae bacterium]|nr:hypothetical protein [Muribaculaceae bacterium]